ncbi:2-C-methyl-D-erythritol 4-phosphate cytidylyltransferase [Pseudocolwellia sp. HL-MZ19]|uniref:2-C-methyl-D-erythritol 4-phosphate cytidylyltransferase n=1 Tax=Pseudocolwellia sp. HL-MZ19 TaxID=3400846 RepID=UPI003CF4462A
MSPLCEKFVVVVPAAGVGKRMQAQCPKQYLTIAQQTILEHTVFKLLSHPLITHVVIAISEGDEYFKDTALHTHQNISVVHGGAERVDSVLAGLHSINSEDFPWVMVHDAARPCVSLDDISALIEQTQRNNCGGLLAYPVRDTMKKSRSVNTQPVNMVLIKKEMVETTIEREDLWHALTPQLYKTNELISAISQALQNKITITDESSAIEYAGFGSLLVEGNGNNIKITRPDDLTLASFILSQQNTEHTTSTTHTISQKVK